MILGSFGNDEDDDFLEILDEILNDRRDTPYERPTLTLDLPDDDVLDVPDVEPEPEAKRVIIIDPNDLGLENQPKRVIIIDL